MKKILLPLLLLTAAPAYAAECPGTKPCKVITIDDDEMKILTGQNGILQTAAQARALDLSQFVIYFQNKLQNAPAGEIKTPPAPAASAVDPNMPPKLPAPDAKSVEGAKPN